MITDKNNKTIIFSKYSTKRILRAVLWLFSPDKTKRRRMRYEMARFSAGLFGDYYLGEDYKRWREDKEFLNNFFQLSPLSPSSEERKFVLREFCHYTRNLSGEMSECGSYTGVSAWFMAKSSPQTNLYLFDSFEGLSAPEIVDRPKNGVQEWNKGDMLANEACLRHNLINFKNVHIMRGWIPSRFPEIASKMFRLVHIDVDLFQPTLDSLEFFYPRLVPGGVIVMDDYGYLTCPGAYKAAHQYMENKTEYILHLPTGQGVIIKSMT